MHGCSAIQIIKSTVFGLLLFMAFSSSAQDTLFEKYHLPTVDVSEYDSIVKLDAEQELVDLQKHVPSVVTDIRYATANNFMKKKMYRVGKAFLRRPAADSLRLVQQELNKLGYGIKIFDAYRPYPVTVAFYEQFRDTTYVASPYSGSRHNRGCAIDITLIELRSGKEIQMPTAYDDFSEKAHSTYRDLPAKSIRNRKLLQRIMQSHGFELYAAEWWHFDFRGWKKYPVMSVSFEELEKDE